VSGAIGEDNGISDEHVDAVAYDLAEADVVGFSSMTAYAELAKRISRRLRQISPATYQVWGGIHPIMHPEDAITSDVDTICRGEGEFAFHQLLDCLERGADPSRTRNFWFKARQGEIVRNSLLPLMTPEQMEEAPFPLYGQNERIYTVSRGAFTVTNDVIIRYEGLTYTAIWSIGCPFHCTFCGNTTFIENDPTYKRIRHPSASYMVAQVASAKTRLPFISHVSFADDSFMALPLRVLQEFATEWRMHCGLPFAVYGVIPNYVSPEKVEVLTWAGMNRVRMGIQSGSAAILDFYERPSPPKRVLSAAATLASFSPKYHIPPAYDIITDNPIETRQDVVDTLRLVYKLDRPFTLYLYALKVIPNTRLARVLQSRGTELGAIDESYLVIPPRWANLLLYLLCLLKPPGWVFELLIKPVRASGEIQCEYRTLGLVLRTCYVLKRVSQHLRFLDFSILPGRFGYVLWRVGLLGWWHRHAQRRADRLYPDGIPPNPRVRDGQSQSGSALGPM
jgi:radical SAM superfamily enzyme YgiQ (UPF0313 family)